MKRILILVLALAMILSLAACTTPPAPSATESESPVATETVSESAEAPESATTEADTSWTDIEAKGSFVLGFDETFAPMGFKDENGEYTGFDIELAREVVSRLGLELELQPIDWDSKVLELNGENIDMIWNGLTITEDRKEDMLFSNPYMNNRQIVVVAADSGIATIADLAGKSVAAQVDSSAMAALEAQPDVLASFGELIESPDYVEALLELKLGSVDAVVVDETMGSYYINEDDNPEAYLILDENFGEEQYGIGFRLTDSALRDKIQETIDAMVADGTFAQISQKWFGYDVMISE